MLYFGGRVAVSAVTQHAAQQQQAEAAESTTLRAQRVSGGELLSQGVEGMSEVLGGSGRAKMVWSALGAGVDPWSEEGRTQYLTPKTGQVLEDTVERLPWKVRVEVIMGAWCIETW